MESCILYIGQKDLSPWIKEILEFIETMDLKSELIIDSSFETAYNHLFSRKISLIISDSNIEGVDEAIGMFKTEEMLTHIPILIITDEDNLDLEKKFLLMGADQTISIDKIENGMLFPYLRPLILSNNLISEKIVKTTSLQEKAINDFILLDLIKAYIPKTIWKIALECAHLQRIKLPEEEKELTVVFGDIKGFTKMSQHLPPKEVISILNEVFEVVTRHIYTHDGDVDKFVGDAFFGIFNSPIDAIKSMVLIQKELEQINKRRKKNKIQTIQFRIGVHTGRVIRGNVGGHKRYDNTLIGDSVNTASRLEQISPVGGVVISDYTRSLAQLDIPDEYCFFETLRGRDCEIKVFSVFDYLKENEKFLSLILN